jgi:hypothetical protein
VLERAAAMETGRQAPAPRYAAFRRNRHHEERSDAAIQESRDPYVPLDCFAALAMTAELPS